jgi:beta-lactamase class A
LLFAALASTFLAPSAGWAAAPNLERLERKSGGRLGLFAYEIGGARSLAHRADERFAMASTFKALLGGMLLDDIARERRDAFQSFPIDRDLVSHSPVLERYRSIGAHTMTLASLIEAIVTVSDNTAANILLELIGGPEAFTARARELSGSDAIRLDRYEPDLNTPGPDDPRDKASPRAVAMGLGTILFSGRVHPQAAGYLKSHMIDSMTGRRRLRAGFPEALVAGDKTGTSGRGVFADIAFAETPDGRRVVVAAYLDAPGLSGDVANEIHSRAGGRVAGSFDLG